MFSNIGICIKSFGEIYLVNHFLIQPVFNLTRQINLYVELRIETIGYSCENNSEKLYILGKL